MHSLNQVNKLVSCGRDPARSLPLWRGFLLIPLILVCFAFAPQTRAVAPAPDGCYGGFNTAEGCQRTAVPHHRRCKYSIWLAFALSTPDRRLQYWRWCWNAGPQPRRMTNTAVGAAALLLNDAGHPKHSCWSGRDWSITQAMPTGNGSFNGAVGAFALNE